MFSSYSYKFPLPWADPVELTPTNVEAGGIHITLWPLWYQEAGISWEVPSRWIVSYFNVYKSQGELGPFERINSEPIRDKYWSDPKPEAYSLFRKNYYQVEAVLVNGAIFRSKAETWENKRSDWVELRAREITRREKLLLRKFVGVKTLWFSRKTYGPRCSRCWSHDLEKVQDSHCPVCYGTGFEGGFLPGKEVLLHYDTNPDNIIVDPVAGNTEQNMISAWTVAFPNMTSRDLVLRQSDASIFRIEEVTETSLQAERVRQILRINELPRDAIENRLLESYFPDRLRYSPDNKLGYEI